MDDMANRQTARQADVRARPMIISNILIDTDIEIIICFTLRKKFKQKSLIPHSFKCLSEEQLLKKKARETLEVKTVTVTKLQQQNMSMLKIILLGKYLQDANK